MSRRRNWITGVLVIALVLPVGAMVPSVTASGASVTNVTVGPFMRVCGARFCIGSNAFYPYGATTYQSTSQAGIDNPAGAISLAQSQQLNTIRLVNFLNPHGRPGTAAYDPTTWAKVDRFIADARAANIKVLLDLSDYRAELWNACTDPYTHGWAKFLTFVANRVNSVTGMTYKSDPEIVMVTFAGEPLPVGSHTFTDGRGRTCTISYSTSQLTRFYASIEAKWRSLDPNHLTAAGGLSNIDLPHSGIDWQSIFGNPDNDVCAFKTYGHMFTWLPTGAEYCLLVLHKPWFNDEWGFTQSMGDDVRALFFKAELANNLANGAAGNFYWNANDRISPTTFDVGPGTPLAQAAVVAGAPA
jgi:aryl-phospho-beta-D-glucosidase BglC (GH1 family)